MGDMGCCCFLLGNLQETKDMWDELLFKIQLSNGIEIPHKTIFLSMVRFPAFFLACSSVVGL